MSASPARFTLHVRLTKGCNADCPYCSSWTPGHGGRMSPADFRSSVDWLASDLFPSIDVGGHDAFLSVEYVGGEVGTVPIDELRDAVFYARERFGLLFGTVRDGCQSNLVVSPAKAIAMDTLFDGRIGTSVDSTSDRRTVGGSARAYRAVHAKAVERIVRRRRRPPGAIYVVDRTGLEGLAEEMALADRQARPLTLRPVFRGGRSVEGAEMSDLVPAMVDRFRDWAMSGRAAVEPFRHLLARRLGDATPACPFQRDCARVSMDLEPDGGLHVCLDMADSGQARLGNALDRTFDREAWSALARRSSVIDPKCASCRWFSACQGGCMSEAIRDTGSPYGRPDLCALWTGLFREIDALVAREGASAVSAWVRGLA